jgi:hypothetical protein
VGEKMIERLKNLIDACEHNQKIKMILLRVAEFPEEKQEDVLRVLEWVVAAKVKEEYEVRRGE